MEQRLAFGRLGNGLYLIDRISFNPDALPSCDFNGFGNQRIHEHQRLGMIEQLPVLDPVTAASALIPMLIKSFSQIRRWMAEETSVSIPAFSNTWAISRIRSVTCPSNSPR